MQLFVRGQNLHTFDVTGGESVFHLKNEIAFAEGIPPMNKFSSMLESH